MEKINIADLLMGCLPGMELDCTLFDDVVFEEVDFSFFKHPVIIRRTGTNTTIHLTKYGQYIAGEDCKCVIFPKGKTTWEGFVPPCKFEDGNIVYIKTNGYYHNEFIIIFKEIKNDHIHKHACFAYKELYTNPNAVCHLVDIEEIRIATEEEKEEIFKAIKENGYKWNEETKKLEKVSQYPQTLEECCTVLGLTELGIIGGYRRGLLTQFRNLLICRDAYWKIAGEQMGLGKPWEPDWAMYSGLKHCIIYSNNEIKWRCKSFVTEAKILAFPTAEMRDAFYDNFEELIKECVRLL